MKTLKLLVLCTLLTIASCSKEVMKDYKESNLNSYLITKSLSTDNYSVSLDDLYKYVGRNKEIINISTQRDELGNLLFYVVNFKDGGYELVSGDKRTFPTLASSQTGFISLNSDNDNANSWISHISEKYNELSSCDSLTSEMEYNIATWEFITGQKETSKTKSTSSYYYLIDFETQSYYSINKGPLLETQWGQSNYQPNDHYWNKYCPWKYDTLTGDRCPVGCVAVAGGQFAYYMKDIVDMNITIPVSASCSGYASNYTRTFSSIVSSSMIYNMPLNYRETTPNKIQNAEIFLAYIGEQVGMNYKPSGSGAALQNLTDLFTTWGLETHYVEYEDSTIRARLMKLTPVITQGFDGNSGHAWVIDGYRKERTLRKNYYYVSNRKLSDTEINELTMADWQGAYDEWEMPEVIKYHMNWGWNGLYDGWYLATDWTVSGYTFEEEQKLIVTYKH